MRAVLLALALLAEALALPAHQVAMSQSQLEPAPAEPDVPGGILSGWVDPRNNGGRFLDYTTPRYGEPLNVIISGRSDPFILTEDGFERYAKSIGYSEECLGLHYGNLHEADLGDGEGRRLEMYLVRQYYFPIWGTCWESFAGGHHFRAWKQNGTVANSGAWFIAASKEEHSRKHHKITVNGYNDGRDWLVDNAVAGTYYKGTWWKAEVEFRTLLEPGHEGPSYVSRRFYSANLTAITGVNHGISQDGRVAILTVNRL
ncbi:hypothetical protein EWM64_g8794 [Hericium alpestre]|uniref:Uncharacterized protein n=1 Tax=Hericium alpestre TaxID=135208 RepID=A0A4Y9ZNW2_9AGAM|nr:hypothetical protein EWM64_g8794 [Hericium alpestre]